jgi:serine/threonine protein kinase
MGEVWRARDLELGRLVAVKVVTRGHAGGPELPARLRREARAAGSLQHPGIAVVHGSGVHDGLPFLVMELLSGENLAEVLARHPAGLPAGTAVRLMAEVAGALAYAHEHGVVHRDVKPANIMLLAGGSAKVCDFGIARVADGSTQITRDGAILGTPAYMAPEQWRGETAGAPADLYALGATLHALLTGAPPFPGQALELLRHQHLNATPPHLNALRTGMPPGLGDLLQRLLAKDPASRPATATDVREALSSLGAAPGRGQATEPTSPPPSAGTVTVTSTRSERLDNFSKRLSELTGFGPEDSVVASLALQAIPSREPP